jgi:hypothetical protein
MKKEKKLKLDGLKIQSFVTELDEQRTEKVKGGNKWESALTCPAECPSEWCSIPC